MEILVGIFPENESPEGRCVTFDDNTSDEEINKKMQEIVLSILKGRHGCADWASENFRPRRVSGKIEI